MLNETYRAMLGNKSVIRETFMYGKKREMCIRDREGTMLLTDEQIRKALDEGALDEAEAQCIDLSDEKDVYKRQPSPRARRSQESTMSRPMALPRYSGLRYRCIRCRAVFSIFQAK